MGFLDKIDNSTIVDAFKQLVKKRDHEVFFMVILQAGTFH